MNKKILYIDMDGVIVDFQSGIDALTPTEYETYKDHFCACPDIFSKMIPMSGALDAVAQLSEKYDVYILSSPSWANASSWSDKYHWIMKYLPQMERRLILSSQKHLNAGDYLIDDRLANGAEKFTGEMLHFGQEKFPDWNAVLKYLL
ncbi:MAG: 5' nucleotidase, NT5C type [Minisyncoccia bacterium]